MKLARGLVIIGSLLLFLVGLMHAFGSERIFPRLASALDAGLFGAIKGLWWSFSVEFVVLSFVTFWSSRLPNGRGLVLLCTLIPAATAALMYRFVGPFIGAHMLAVASVFLAVGGFLLPPGRESHPASRVW